jgi:hypothetical protein
MMKSALRIMIWACLACCLSAGTLAQEGQKGGGDKSKPDLSGTWALDKEKSDKVKIPLLDNETTLVIVQRDPEISMTHTASLGDSEMPWKATYYTDGRGEAYQSPLGGGSVKSKTRWDGNKLQTRYTIQKVYPGRVVNVDVIEEWKLSKDGKTLTQRLAAVPQPGGQRRGTVSRVENQRIFNRVSQ